MVLAVKSAWTGLLAGCLHTLAGADHLAVGCVDSHVRLSESAEHQRKAVVSHSRCKFTVLTVQLVLPSAQALTPLTIGRSRASSALLGGLWGAGHSTGQLLLGLMMVLLKDRFNALMPALTKWGSTMVGLTLLAIGVMGIYEGYFEKHDEASAEVTAIGAACDDCVLAIWGHVDEELHVFRETVPGTERRLQSTKARSLMKSLHKLPRPTKQKTSMIAVCGWG